MPKLKRSVRREYRRGVKEGVITQEEADRKLAELQWKQDMRTGDPESHLLSTCSPHCPCRSRDIAFNE